MKAASGVRKASRASGVQKSSEAQGVKKICEASGVKKVVSEVKQVQRVRKVVEAFATVVVARLS